MRVLPQSLRIAARAMMLFALSGCAGYTVGGVRYRSANGALNRLSTRLEEQVAQTPPMAYIGGSVLLPLPADRELACPPYAAGKISRISPRYAFALKYWRREIGAAQAALERSQVFDTEEVRRVDEPNVYAREYGYRFILRDQGLRWFLEDTLTGRVQEMHGVDLRDLAERTHAAAAIMQAAHATATARGVAPAGANPVEDKHGGLRIGFPGEAIEARARILSRARQECSGAFRIDDEFLHDELLTVRFTCVGQRLTSR